MLCIAFISSALAQEDSLLNEEAQKIRISGIIITADSLREVTNTNIYVNDRLETYSSDTSGFFSLFAQPSDTITFTSLGYHQGKFIVPKGLAGQDYSLVQTLVPDTVILDEITIYPLPTAREFINAFRDSALIYNDKYEHMRENVERVDEMDDEEAFLSKYQPPEVNHGYGRLYNNRYGPIPGNNFLNPDRWRDFILDLQDYNFDGEGY
ncbi:MAG: hypothetical protein ACLFUB_03280 [Cyclobacteriaceae bacterium]